MDGFHPGGSLDLTDECCERILTVLHKVEMAGKWPANASTTSFSSHVEHYVGCLLEA